mmetsp:Transcript_16883/g.20062  ORF Transcript_16883/g.20062 Transcript_16883/m.20062 type:complete len:339 (+) Transcript_16883:175-1191(+)
MSNTAEVDEFQDAVESSSTSTPNGIALAASTGDDDDEQTFDVGQDELTLIRAQLASDYPEDYQTLSDTYICSVASKPYSKDPTIRRPLEYTTEKLNILMGWRRDNAIMMEEMVNLVSMPETGKENTAAMVENPDRFTKAKALAVSMNYGSMYWHGLDKGGRPVLWIRCGRMPWYPDVEAQVNSLILLADAGIKYMPKGITDFVVISDSNSPPPPNPQFMINVLSALVKGYPDRLNLLVSCPVGTIIQMIMKVLLPLMPGRLASKIVLVTEEETIENLGGILENGIDDIPDFLGGKCSHEGIYPVGGTFPERTLKFDYRGMVRRLDEATKKFSKGQSED